MRGLFLHSFTAGSIAAKKFGELQRLCMGHDVVVVQEAHGNVADLTTLAKDISSHVPFGTFTDCTGAGGCITLVKRSLFAKANNHSVVEVVAGRCIVLNLNYGELVLQIGNIHIEPGMGRLRVQLALTGGTATLLPST